MERGLDVRVHTIVGDRRKATHAGQGDAGSAMAPVHAEVGLDVAPKIPPVALGVVEELVLLVDRLSRGPRIARVGGGLAQPGEGVGDPRGAVREARDHAAFEGAPGTVARGVGLADRHQSVAAGLSSLEHGGIRRRAMQGQQGEYLAREAAEDIQRRTLDAFVGQERRDDCRVVQQGALAEKRRDARKRVDDRTQPGRCPYSDVAGEVIAERCDVVADGLEGCESARALCARPGR